MAIKTRTQLGSQSNTTFPDNNTGQIIPVNHRAFNDDSLDTIFSIAGRTMTIAAFNTLRTANELVPGCNYRFEGVSLPAMNGNPSDFIVTATTNNAIAIFGVIITGGAFIRIFVPQNIDTDLIRVAEIQTLSPDDITDFVPLAAADRYYSWTEVAVVPDNDVRHSVIHERIDTINSNVILNHNIEGESITGEKVIGYHPISATGFEPNLFYPDNGNEVFYGPDFNTPNAEIGFTYDLTGSQISDITNLKVNWQKVNQTIFGMVAFDAVFNLGGGGNPWFTFELPTQGQGAIEPQIVASVIGHGHAIDTSSYTHPIMVSITGISTGIISRAMGQCNLNLLGNHSNPLNVRVEFSFSYSINPYA